MPRFKPYDYRQTAMVPVDFEQQILPGTFEHSIHYLVDNELDLSLFDSRFCNDETGRPAYDPAILLKIVLLAYSRGRNRGRALINVRSCNIKPEINRPSAISTRDRAS